MIKDSNGKTIKVGDKVFGEGCLRFQDNFKIDLSPVVTVSKKEGVYYFGSLSKGSFGNFYKFEEDKNKPKPF